MKNLKDIQYKVLIAFDLYNIYFQRTKKILISSLYGGRNYKFSQSRISMHSNKLSHLGKGGFSNVYLQYLQEKPYACKQIALPLQAPLSYLLDEMNTLRCINHPNIACMYGFRLHSFTSFDILLQYVQGKTIDQIYTSTDEELLFYWIFQMSLALIHLQEKGIVHRDLKPKNILVDQKGLIKIVDFGIAKVLHNKSSHIVGSPSYIAPEIIKKNYVDHSSDIWSLGITIYELLHKSLPFNLAFSNMEDKSRFFDQICNGEIKMNEEECSFEMALLVRSMLDRNPKTRITARGILNHYAIKRREQVFSKWYTWALQQN